MYYVPCILDFTLAQRSSGAGVGSWSDTLSTITPFVPSAGCVFIVCLCQMTRKWTAVN